MVPRHTCKIIRQGELFPGHRSQSRSSPSKNFGAPLTQVNKKKKIPQDRLQIRLVGKTATRQQEQRPPRISMYQANHIARKCVQIHQIILEISPKTAEDVETLKGQSIADPLRDCPDRTQLKSHKKQISKVLDFSPCKTKQPHWEDASHARMWVLTYRRRNLLAFQP